MRRAAPPERCEPGGAPVASAWASATTPDWTAAGVADSSRSWSSRLSGPVVGVPAVPPPGPAVPGARGETPSTAISPALSGQAGSAESLAGGPGAAGSMPAGARPDRSTSAGGRPSAPRASAPSSDDGDASAVLVPRRPASPVRLTRWSRGWGASRGLDRQCRPRHPHRRRWGRTALPPSRPVRRRGQIRCSEPGSVSGRRWGGCAPRGLYGGWNDAMRRRGRRR